MGAVIKLKASELGARLKADQRKLIANLKKAAQKTAHDAVPILLEAVPHAFGELASSIHAGRMKTVVDATHAAAVEVGSMPHTPPMAPLIAWVGLKITGDPESPETYPIAKAIQQKIKAEGTKPTHFVRGSLPLVRDALALNVKGALTNTSAGSSYNDEGEGESGGSGGSKQRRLTTEEVRSIRAAKGTHATIAKQFNVHRSTVGAIRRFKTHKFE